MKRDAAHAVRRALVAALLAAATLVACGGDSVDPEVRQAALDFTRALTARDYARAHAMTTEAYREAVSVDALQQAFEAVVPADWGETEPLEIVTTLRDWPDRRGDEEGWVFVSIPGDVYSEAVAVVVAREAGALRIREIEMGRP